MDFRRPTGASLAGAAVRLDRSVRADAPALFAALDADAVWAGAYHGGRRPGSPDEVAAWVDDAGAEERVMYTVRTVADSALGPAGSVIGTSSLGDVLPAHRQLHLGWTAYAPAAWGSAVNPECKLLLLAHAFDCCGAERVRIQTDAINARSQAAIAALGAAREGVLRHDRLRADGSWRDTVVFSILAAEWPAVRRRLGARLTAATLPAG